jgi:hypothetical protein
MFTRQKLFQGSGWKRWLVLIAFIFVLGFTALQAVRTMRHFIGGQYQRDEEMHGWMTLGYLGHSYRVPPQVLQQALGLPASPPDTRPLARIAKAQGRSLDELIVSLQAAITQARSSPNDVLPPKEPESP